MSPYLASDEAAQQLFGAVVFLIFGASWWPAHHVFKWLRKKHHSPEVLTLSIVGCIIATYLLVIMGLAIGRHMSPGWRSLGAKSGIDPININFMWAPFALFAGGLWGGLLSGYFKVPFWPPTKRQRKKNSR